MVTRSAFIILLLFGLTWKPVERPAFIAPLSIFSDRAAAPRETWERLIRKHKGVVKAVVRDLNGEGFAVEYRTALRYIKKDEGLNTLVDSYKKRGGRKRSTQPAPAPPSAPQPAPVEPTPPPEPEQDQRDLSAIEVFQSLGPEILDSALKLFHIKRYHEALRMINVNAPDTREFPELADLGFDFARLKNRILTRIALWERYPEERIKTFIREQLKSRPKSGVRQSQIIDEIRGETGFSFAEIQEYLDDHGFGNGRLNRIVQDFIAENQIPLVVGKYQVYYVANSKLVDLDKMTLWGDKIVADLKRFAANPEHKAFAQSRDLTHLKRIQVEKHTRLYLRVLARSNVILIVGLDSTPVFKNREGLLNIRFVAAMQPLKQAQSLEDCRRLGLAVNPLMVNVSIQKSDAIVAARAVEYSL